MKYLLDVCALIALGYRSHVHNQRVERWAVGVRREMTEPVSFASCAITELGFIRIGSANTNARFAHDVGTARMLLRRTKLRLPFVFIADDLGAEQLPPWV